MSDPLNIEVKQLPKANRPISFNGAIGTFSIRSVADHDRVSLGDPVRLTIEISGKGNFTAMPAPTFESNSNFKIGPPAFSFEGNQLIKHEGKQSFEYILTPLTAGLLKIPSISFSYFDPIQEEYFIVNSKEHPLRVDPGEKWVDPTNNETAISPQNLVIPTVDLFQTENEPGVWVKNIQNKTMTNSTFFWYIQGVPFCAAIGLLFYGRKRIRSGRDIFRQKRNFFKKANEGSNRIQRRKPFLSIY